MRDVGPRVHNIGRSSSLPLGHDYRTLHHRDPTTAPVPTTTVTTGYHRYRCDRPYGCARARDRSACPNVRPARRESVPRRVKHCARACKRDCWKSGDGSARKRVEKFIPKRRPVVIALLTLLTAPTTAAPIREQTTRRSTRTTDHSSFTRVFLTALGCCCRGYDDEHLRRDAVPNAPRSHGYTETRGQLGRSVGR